MDLKEIQNLIRFVAKSGASEVKLEMDDVKITIKTGSDEGKETTIVQQIPISNTVPQPPISQLQKPQVSIPEVSTPPAQEEDSNYLTIKSPIIGTFL